MVISYQIPTYKAGRRRLYLAVWQHGVSIYGWQEDRDGGFSRRHAQLLTGRATIRLGPSDADEIPDEEFRELARSVLAP